MLTWTIKYVNLTSRDLDVRVNIHFSSCTMLITPYLCKRRTYSFVIIDCAVVLNTVKVENCYGRGKFEGCRNEQVLWASSCFDETRCDGRGKSDLERWTIIEHHSTLLKTFDWVRGIYCSFDVFKVRINIIYHYI